MRSPIEIVASCPRRHNGENPWLLDNEVGWERRDSLLHCSYCGSLKPDWLLWAMTQGAELGPTDKNYKVYVSYADVNHDKFYFQHFSEEEKNKFIELYNARPRTFTIGYPGYFYVAPFFAVRKEVSDGN